MRPSRQHRFVSVIAWPRGTTRDDHALILADALGSDFETQRLRAGQTLPGVVGWHPADAARRAVKAIRRHGGDAIGPSLADLEALGQTLKIRDMRLDGDGFAVDLWRGPMTRLRFADIDVIVRAQLSERKATPTASPMLESLGRMGHMPAGGAWGGLGSYGMAAAFAAEYGVVGGSAGSARRESAVRVSNKLDIHVRQGMVFQIDADKFAFGVLGDSRGQGDKFNTDALCELIAHVAPHAVVDPFYSLWKPPSQAGSLALRGSRLEREDLNFAFYSRWMALIYRHMADPSFDPGMRDQS